MLLFGRDHECKEYERWSEKQVGIVSGMKWTLRKNQGDPHRDTGGTQSHWGQQMNNEALILRENDVSKCLWSRTKDQAPSKTPLKVTRRWMSKMSNSRTTLKYRKECAQRKLPYVNYMKMPSVGCPTTWLKYVSWSQKTVSCVVEGEV